MDKVKVTLITDADEVRSGLAVARKVYDERNRRLESHDRRIGRHLLFLPRSASRSRPTTCASSRPSAWACAAPTTGWTARPPTRSTRPGPNQPVKKGECLDPVQGVWKGINDFVYANSHKAIEAFCAYSIMDRPMTSCGCFEVICAYVPECNGVMAVNREFLGDTPVGMTFSTLAGTSAAASRRPASWAAARCSSPAASSSSPKAAIERLIWMPKELKTLLAEDLKKRFAEQGVPDLFDKIADETVATDAKRSGRIMEKVGHPALTMPDMAEATPSRRESSAPSRSSRAAPVSGSAKAAHQKWQAPASVATRRPDTTATPPRRSPRRNRSSRSRQRRCARCKRELDAASPADRRATSSQPSAASSWASPRRHRLRAAPANADAAPRPLRLRPDRAAHGRARVSPRITAFTSAKEACRDAGLDRQARRHRGPRAAPAAAPTASAAPPPCRSISGKARCPIRRSWPWKSSTWSARNTRACCGRSTATCCSIPPRWPRLASRNTAPT